MASRYVVFAGRLRGFQLLEDALRFAEVNTPSVVCERRDDGDGHQILVEIARHDFLYDPQRDEWRIMLQRTAG